MSFRERLGHLLPESHRQLFIGGAWVPGSGGRRIDVIDPADGSVLTDVADGSLDDARAALDAAVAAQADWAATAGERGDPAPGVRAGDGARRRPGDRDEPGDGQADRGRRREVTYGAEFLRWFSEEAVRVHGRWMQSAGGSRLLTVRKPVGPRLFITPWNFPLAMGTRQDRARDRGRLHDGGQAGVAQTPLTMLTRRAVSPRRAARRGVNVVTTSDSGGPQQHHAGRPAAAEGELHGVHRRRQEDRRAVGGRAAAGLHGARRQRPFLVFADRRPSTRPSRAR